MNSNKTIDVTASGPMAGEPTPIFGGSPDETVGCNGCTDCCHLPEIAITAEESDTLSTLYDCLSEPAGMLIVLEDPKRCDWRLMKGPCAFRAVGDPTPAACRIYDNRPGSCRVFTCRLLLDLRRR